MCRYNVHNNNKWACFSSISDGFITHFMDKSAYEEWRICQYGISDYRPAEECNTVTLREAVSSVRMHNTNEETLKQLIECGLSTEECEKLLYDLETEQYCPILKENGKHECPNCGSEVKLGQRSCNKETCEITFVWRVKNNVRC